MWCIFIVSIVYLLLRNLYSFGSGMLFFQVWPELSQIWGESWHIQLLVIKLDLEHLSPICNTFVYLLLKITVCISNSWTPQSHSFWNLTNFILYNVLRLAIAVVTMQVGDFDEDQYRQSTINTNLCLIMYSYYCG